MPTPVKHRYADKITINSWESVPVEVIDLIKRFKTTNFITIPIRVTRSDLIHSDAILSLTDQEKHEIRLKKSANVVNLFEKCRDYIMLHWHDPKNPFADYYRRLIPMIRVRRIFIEGPGDFVITMELFRELSAGIVPAIESIADAIYLEEE